MENKTPENDAPQLDSIVEETRVDEFAVEMFKALGFNTLLPDSLVELYNDFKKGKDRLQACRLTPEMFATLVMMDRKFTAMQAEIDAFKAQLGGGAKQSEDSPSEIPEVPKVPAQHSQPESETPEEEHA